MRAAFGIPICNTQPHSILRIKRRLDAMKQIYDAGIRTVCFIAPVFPGILDFEAIFHQVRNQCDLIWLENLNLRDGFKKTSWTISDSLSRGWFGFDRKAAL